MTEVVMLQEQFSELREELSDPDGLERAAFLFCGRSVESNRVRLLVKRVHQLDPRLIRSERHSVRIPSIAYVPAIARADRNDESLILVHSHPTGVANFSKADDDADSELFRVANARAPSGPHASMILIGESEPTLIARTIGLDGEFEEVPAITVVGDKIVLFGKRFGGDFEPEPWASRQVAAFGPRVQQILSKLTIGVIGAGGTGSAVIEQLCRLGVGRVLIIDKEPLSESNVTRVHGSGVAQAGSPKTQIARDHARFIGLGTEVEPLQGNLATQQIASKAKECDFLFGCTDDHEGRAILNRVAVYYNLPALDMAVLIDSTDGTIREITGRVTYLRPGTACLLCRGRINADRIAAEATKRTNPDEYEHRRQDGYAPELEMEDPAVVMFTTHIAARALAWFLHLYTGYLGDDFTSTELLDRFHWFETNRNSRQGRADHYCMDANKWGVGDVQPFLGKLW